MALAQFSKIAIFGLQNEREHLLKVLQDSQLVEIAETAGEPDEKLFAERIATELQHSSVQVEKRLAEITRALSFLDLIVPVKPNMVQQFAGIKTYLTPKEFTRILNEEERLQRLVASLARFEQELTQLQTRKVQLQSLADNLTPWQDLDLTYSDLQGSALNRVFLGSTNQPLAEIEANLQEANLSFHLEPVKETGVNTLFVLITPAEQLGSVQTVLARFNVTPATLPPFETTVAAKLEETQREQLKLDKEEGRIREQVRSLEGERKVLQVFYDTLINERNRMEVAEQLTHAERSFYISGWIIASKLTVLEEMLSKVKLHFVIVPTEAEEGEQPPTVLQNNEFISPFEYLVQSFSYPQAHEIDPTASIAPFFFLFFGIALGDAGYGLMLALVCGIFLVKLKLGPVGKKLSWMFLFSGIGAIVVGLLTGSVLSLPVKFGLFNPLENPILLLVIALGIGLAQLYYGLFISAYYSIREGKWGAALSNQGTLIFFLTSVILVLAKDAIGLMKYGSHLVLLLVFAAIGMVVGNMVGKKGLVAKLVAIPGAFYNMYNTIGFFSDVLSYSRLMALGLSGGVMGGIMNQLAGMVFNSMPVIGWILGAAIFLFGHLLNFALSVLGAYVHSSRLQYLEFFGKFFEGGGRPFTPFGNKPKYTFLVDEREA
ncbi:MAG TPA: V-type ATPase 116kDa subunit family protein [Bacillota bacterium]|nr:V-type ATPase 116kDa subunit family protein [Bacillota bacterium]